MKHRSNLVVSGLFTLIVWTVFVHLHVLPANAATLTLSWDAIDPTPDGYQVFKRIDGQPYDDASPAWPIDGNNHTETTCTLDGLAEGVTYYFVVRAYMGLDVSLNSNEIQFQTALAAAPAANDVIEPEISGGIAEATDVTSDVSEPEISVQIAEATDVTTDVSGPEISVQIAEATGSGTESVHSLTLSWDALDPAPDGYRVFQRVDGQPYDDASPVWPIDGNNHTETTCTLDGLAEGVTYYFVVRAYVGLDVSVNSNEIQFQASISVAEAPAEDDVTSEPVISGDLAEATDSGGGGGTDSGLEPPPPGENTDIGLDTQSDVALTSDSDTNTDTSNDIEPSPPQQQGDEAVALPSLEILDTSYAHVGWLSIQWSESLALDGESHIAMCDIDGDGKDEMVIGFGRTDESSLPGGRFQIVDDDYSVMGWGQIDWADYNSVNGESYPTCGDIDGDGDDEILIGLGEGGQGMVEVFDYLNGSVVHLDWITVNWPEYNTLFGQTHPAAGDIDNDGKDEIIIGLGSDNSDPQMPAGLFQIFDDDLSMLSWGQIDWPEYNQNNGESYPTVGYIKQKVKGKVKGRNMILVGLGSGGLGKVETFQFNAGVVTHSGWITVDWDDYNQTIGQTRPASGDIDGDGFDEILIGLGSNVGDPNIPGGRFPVLDDNATLITWAQVGWPEYNAANGKSLPVSGDLDGNGIDDIFVGLGAKNALAAETMLPSSADSSAAKSESGGGGGCFISVSFSGRH